MSHACLICGHTPHGGECGVQGCSCVTFAETPAPETDMTLGDLKGRLAQADPVAVAGPTPNSELMAGGREFMAELEQEFGPIPEGVRADVQAKWAGPTPNHQQAIHAANDAIVEGTKQMHLTNAGMDVGRVAVEAAAPILLQEAEELLETWHTAFKAADKELVATREQLQAAQAEVTQTRQQITEYENAINWDVSCLSCARILNASIADHERAEKAEAAQAEVERYKAFEQRIRPGEFAPKQPCTCHGCTRMRDALWALDLAAQRKDPQP